MSLAAQPRMANTRSASPPASVSIILCDLSFQSSFFFFGRASGGEKRFAVLMVSAADKSVSKLQE